MDVNNYIQMVRVEFKYNFKSCFSRTQYEHFSGGGTTLASIQRKKWKFYQGVILIWRE